MKVKDFEILQIEVTYVLSLTCSKVYSRQILTSKVDPRTVRFKIFLMAADNIDIQMNRKELTKTFMMISN